MVSLLEVESPELDLLKEKLRMDEKKRPCLEVASIVVVNETKNAGQSAQ